VRSKIRSKIHPKITKLKILQHKIGYDLTQKHGYIDANKEFTRCGNHHNILPLFRGLEGSLTFFRGENLDVIRVFTSP
jgi:hypothetical protein